MFIKFKSPPDNVNSFSLSLSSTCEVACDFQDNLKSSRNVYK